MEYVLEVIRAEGTSEWRTCAHDEFPLCMDGEVTVELVKLDTPAVARRQGGLGRASTASRSGKPMGRIVLRKGHMALLPGQRRVPVQRGDARRDPAADHPRRRHRRALGRDLPQLINTRRDIETHRRRHTNMTTMTDTFDRRPVIRTQLRRLPRVRPRRVPLPPRRVLRPHHLADRRARDEHRRVPARAAARRGVGLLLRHRQLRQRVRHRQPLRHRRHVRRPVQRRLPQGRARPHRELRDAA